jgi:hypothetical protein
MTFCLPSRYGGGGILALLLLLLLVDLLYELLDPSTLLDAMAVGVVHRAPLATLVSVEQLTRAHVATPPTSRCSCSGGSTNQQLVLAASLLLLLFATALGSNICVGLAGLPCVWGRL